MVQKEFPMCWSLLEMVSVQELVDQSQVGGPGEYQVLSPILYTKCRSTRMGKCLCAFSSRVNQSAVDVK